MLWSFWSWRAKRDRKIIRISYSNNLIFKGSMELHVDEIIFIFIDVVKQHVRFILIPFWS